MVPESFSFDRLADRYDAARGGLERGDRVAAGLLRHLNPDVRTLEVGVGTGVIANGMRAVGFEVIGVDLAPKMLAVARARVGPLACADASRLPFGDSCFGQVYTSWLLHLVGDGTAVLREIARVMTRDATYVDVPATDHAGDDPISRVAAALPRRLRQRLRREERAFDVVEASRDAGLEVIDVGHGPAFRWMQRPADVLDNITNRVHSFLLDVPDEVWAEEVEPVIEGLRALPDEPVERTSRDRYVVMRRA